jgi:NTE family protein
MPLKPSRRLLISLVVASAFSHAAHAQEAVPREKIGLVLSGGGARGLAHIGIIRSLEEQHIPIDFIAGTSAGALIGGMYASGMGIDEIEEKVKKLDLGAIAFAPEDRRELKQDVRNLNYQANSIIDVSVKKDGSITLPIAVSNGAKVDAVLRTLLQTRPYDVDFEKLPIPFNAVAADLATGKMVVLQKGQLARALRASMSIPAIFAPVEMNGQILVDGMIDRNLPVDVARKMGATRIIAVDVGSDLLTKDKLNNVLSVTEQLGGLLVKRNVDEQIATLTANDVYIRPDLGDLANLDFKEGAKAAALGYKAMQSPALQSQLAHLSVSPERYSAMMRQHAAPDNAAKTIDFIRIQTHGLARPETLRAEIKMQEGQPFDLKTVNQDVASLLSAGRISQVSYSVQAVGDRNELVYDVTERDEARDALHAGIEVASNSLSDQQFSLHLAHRRVWLNSLGGEWRNHLTFGQNTRIKSELNQPLNPQGSLFIRPSIELSYTKSPFYLPNSNHQAGKYTKTELNYGFTLGQPIGRIGEWGVGLNYRTAQLKANNDNPLMTIQADKDQQLSATANLTVDQIDDTFTPSSGYFGKIYSSVGLSKNDGKRYMGAGFQGLYATHYNAHSMSASLELGGQSNSHSVYFSPYYLGGYNRLAGYASNQFIGNYLAYGNLAYRYRTDVSILNNPLVLGAMIEAGNTWLRADDVRFGDFKYATSLFGALKTPIGPAQLGVGFTQHGKANFYLILGRTLSDFK